MKENWTYKKFGEAFNLLMGKTPSRDNVNYWGGENIWVSIADLKGKYIEETKEHITDTAVTESGISKIPQGTAIMSFKLTIGKAAITKCDLFTNEAIMSFVPKEENTIDADYLYYYLKSCKWAGANKAVMGQTLNKKTIAENIFAYPPLPTQHRIVSELDLLQSIIDKQQAQLKELDTLAQAVFYDMFGDPVENEKGWEVKRLSELGTCVSGGTPSRKKSDYFTGNINWYSAGELNSLFLGESVEKITQEALDNSAAKLCKENSLYIGMYDTAAFKLGISKKASASNQACANIDLNEANVIWLYYTLFIMREEAMKHRHGVRQKNLNLGFIKSFEVPVPPLSLQQSFSSKIESIEKQKATIAQSITETQKLFNYTMDKYFG